MAATVVTTASTLEGQALEVIRELVQAEDAWVAAGLALETPETRQRRFTLTPNFTAGTISISGTLPIAFDDAVDGLVITASTYLP